MANKRVKQISAMTHNGSTKVEVSISLVSNGYLTAKERERAIAFLADGVMQTIAVTPHMTIPLSTIRVRP